MDFMKVKYEKIDPPAAKCVNHTSKRCSRYAVLRATLTDKETWCCTTACCKIKAREWLQDEIGVDELARLEAEMRQQYEAALATKPVSVRKPRTPTGGRKRCKPTFATHDTPNPERFIV